MHSPYISIIIPVYKVEPYIQECLDSVLNWQFTGWEAILIDDGSPDNCGAICDKYAAKDFRFKVIHKENEGVSIARNAGLDIARGEWCWFVDSDDIINSSLSVDQETLQGRDLVMFNMLTFKDGIEKQTFTSTKTIENYVEKKNFFSKNISSCHPTLWFHRIFWAKDEKYAIRFPKGIKLGEDGEFMRKCEFVAQHPIKIQETSYFYRLREGSATSNPDKSSIIVKDAFSVLHNLLIFIQNHNIEDEGWHTDRLNSIAKSIPVNAIKANIWNQATIKQFQNVIKGYKCNGFNLQKDKAIWLSTMMPRMFTLLMKIKLNKFS